MDNIFQVDINPFTDEYMQQEVNFYGLQDGYENSGITVAQREMPGQRLDDYLNKNFRIDVPSFPVLYIDGKTWMSLTFMELQSGFLPIEFAQGRVACGGLGLGYFLLRAMAKPTVESIDVYEREARIITFFKDAFSHRPGFEKLTFIEGDIHEQLHGKQYDFVYIDIYQTLLPDEVISDMLLFCRKNEIEQYHFWGIEKVLIDAHSLGVLEVQELPWAFRDYFKLWIEANENHEMYNCSHDELFLQKAVTALREVEVGVLDEI